MIHDANGAALEWDDFCPPRNHYLLQCRTFHLQFVRGKSRLSTSSNTTTPFLGRHVIPYSVSYL